MKLKIDNALGAVNKSISTNEPPCKKSKPSTSDSTPSHASTTIATTPQPLLPTATILPQIATENVFVSTSSTVTNLSPSLPPSNELPIQKSKHLDTTTSNVTPIIATTFQPLLPTATTPSQIPTQTPSTVTNS